MLRIVVLGAGPEAERHARAFAALPEDCLLTGVYDGDEAAAQASAAALGVPASTGMLEALDADAAIVAGGLEQRARLGRAALEQGLDVLLEPPLASDVSELGGLRSALVRAPRRPVAMVAHDLSFAPAIVTLRTLLEGQQLVCLQAEHRTAVAPGPVPQRTADVVSELMTHDLQLLLSLGDGPVAATQASGRRLRAGAPVDHAQALLTLEDDTVLSLIASRAGGPAVRRIVATTAAARVTADLGADAVEAVRTSRAAGGAVTTAVERIAVAAADPAVAQAQTFLRSVQRRTPAKVGIAQALATQEALAAILRRIDLVGSRPAGR